ncbi:hypothetical protein [Pulveribacter sp.]|uniref:hypothetical protein n=1 Tax=Pulveribacter sp. TaxID=2678893 RepID=UPI0028AFA83D|nr:hypothetical protein [Pulveribacter sp.]
MENIQLELDFEDPPEAGLNSGAVVAFSAYAHARAQRIREAERAKLLEEIVRSVEHIADDISDLKAM